MRLIALRGATHGRPRTSADAILGATEELMREMLDAQRPRRAEDLVVSCIFTLTEDLDAEFPAVAARRMGLSRGAAPVRARDRRCPARCRA